MPLSDFSHARILVLGDIMLDRYWSGPCQRISPEAPVPIVQVQQEQDRLGGGANVARNAVHLGAHACVLGRRGTDAAGERLRALCDEAGIENHWIIDGPTTLKLRIHSRQQQLIRVDFEEKQPLLAEQWLPLLTRVNATFRPNALVLSDYGKGVLAEVAPIIDWARSHALPILIDPTGSDYGRYRGATVLTPNVAELEAAMGPCPNDDSLLQRGDQLLREQQLTALLITRSERGMTLLRPHEAPFHLPTQAREVFDVTGAGDTVIATLASGLATGMDWQRATVIANAAAGVVVGKWGTATASRDELEAILHPQAPFHRQCLDVNALVKAVQQRRALGERIVFTNGCFDLLHAGHVTYLQQAKALGDRLIVAVNDDSSVARLKGNSRPINPLTARMAVLAGLACVDWVTAFSEDTPQNLIEQLVPDVLVKGGDYAVEAIVGGDFVRAHGGEVRVLPFLTGFSTTQLIERAKDLP